MFTVIIRVDCSIKKQHPNYQQSYCTKNWILTEVKMTLEAVYAQKTSAVMQLLKMLTSSIAKTSKQFCQSLV